MDYDVVVVGGGAAGLSAAMMLGRSRRAVTVVDAGEPRNTPAAHLHGLLSRDGTTPAELLDVGREEVVRYGGEVRDDRARRIERLGEHEFVVHLASGAALTTRGVLVATGLRDELPDVPGLGQRWGSEVLHCPYCHGHEVADGAFGVLGGDNRPFTLHQAQLVRQWSRDVVFFPNRIVVTDEERARLIARGIRIVDGEVARLVVDDDQVSGVELVDGTVVPRSVVFVGPRFVPRDHLLTDLGCALGDNGWVATDASGRTSIDGVWAAGNVVDSPAQLVSAASAGSTAAVAINHHLLAQDVDRAVANHGTSTEVASRA